MSAAPATEVYLVRHGETDWNRLGRLQGTVNTPLNHIGVRQARQLAAQFHALSGATVVTSPLARARSTAQAIVGLNCVPLVVDPLLAEIDHGAWTGRTLASIARTRPGVVIDGRVQSGMLDGGCGEALAAAYRRASTALRRFVEMSSTTRVVAVSHGVINALLLCAAGGCRPEDLDRYTQPNGGTYRLRFRRRLLATVDFSPLNLSSSSAGSGSLSNEVP